MLNQSYILSILYIDVGLKGHSFYCYILDNYLGHFKALVQWNAHNCGIKTGYEVQRIRSLKKKNQFDTSKTATEGGSIWCRIVTPFKSTIFAAQYT